MVYEFKFPDVGEGITCSVLTKQRTKHVRHSLPLQSHLRIGEI
jgi:hypothetical protein